MGRSQEGEGDGESDVLSNGERLIGNGEWVERRHKSPD